MCFFSDLCFQEAVHDEIEWTWWQTKRAIYLPHTHTHHISLIRDILVNISNGAYPWQSRNHLFDNWRVMNELYLICFHFASSICIVAICNGRFWHGQCFTFNHFISFIHICRGFFSLSLTSFCEYCSLYETRYNLILETTLINGKQKN